ncbi:MAG: AsmA family protein [Candidatus Acidiferrales bacterium]
MSDTLSQSVAGSQPLPSVHVRPRGWSRWLKWIVLLFVFLWFAQLGLSLLIRHTRLQRRITARLETAFGRPVQVGNYNFSLWGGPTLKAQSVMFGEDPRFGHEYFLRAESLTVRLRWQGLLRGHIQLGTVSMQRPSLNLVSNLDGDWNLAEWLPKPAPAGSSSAVSSTPTSVAQTVRFSRIEVDSGRINFKRGDEKLPFALVGVTGYVEPAEAGRWAMDLEAIPTRAAVNVQQAGVLHVSGHMGGTSSRLRPAELDASWSDASLPDVLRLARSSDYGVRGMLTLILNARTEDRENGWTIQSRAEFRQLHRWDLALRADNPALNVLAKILWNPMTFGFDVTDAAIEAPHSHARASGHIGWETTTQASAPRSSPVSINVTSSQIDLNDVLAWIRSFHSDVAPDISLHGFASVDGNISGWPWRMNHAAVAIDGASLAGSRLRVPARLGNLQFHYDDGIASLAPVSLSFGASASSFRMETSRKPGSPDFPIFHLSGNLTQARDLIATAGALGWNISRGWDLAGPVRCDLRWQGAAFPWRVQPTGSIDWGGESGEMSLRTPFLNQPIENIRAHAYWRPGSHHISLSSAAAFGARWAGSFDRRESGGWQFALSADHLAVADVDRWLNPQWRESFFDRVLPFLNPRAPTNAVTDNLHATGRITVDQFALAPVVVRRLQGDLKVEGHHIYLTNAHGQFYGGNIGASFDADFAAIPSYRLNVDFLRVDLAALSADSPNFENVFAGAASGEFSLHARGATKSDLLASLACKGKARVSDAEFRSLSLTDSLREGASRPGVSSFNQVSAAFACGDREIKFAQLLLLAPSGEINAVGTLDFTHNLDFRLRVLKGEEESRGARSSDYRLTGPLSAPELTRIPAVASHP